MWKLDIGAEQKYKKERLAAGLQSVFCYFFMELVK